MGVARTVVMCRHLGFTEAHSAEWGWVREGIRPHREGGPGGYILEIKKNKDLFTLLSR